MNRSLLSALSFSVATCLSVPAVSAQSHPYRGLWVGEVLLGAVNEVTVPLDAANIPRAPDPNVPTPTSDTASLRLIIHVDSTGHASLLKYVAILARKEGAQESDSDLALVTNERLYGSFPPQAAMRISSAAFDFGDAKATAAVNTIVQRAASSAATAAALPNATVASVKAAVLADLTPLLAPSDVSARFTTFLQTNLNAVQVKAIAAGGPTTTAMNAAIALRDGSFYGDTRGIDMLNAIISALAANPSASPAEKEKLALQIAASFAETDDAYERFLAGEILGNMIPAAASAAAAAAAAEPLKQSTSFSSADGGASVVLHTTAHGLSTGDEIAILGAPIGAYNKLHTVTRLDNNTFKISAAHIAGGTIQGYSGSTAVAPLVVVSPGHGLSGESLVGIRGSLGTYNGSHIATPINPDSFSIPVVFSGNPVVKGSWSIRGGNITAYTGTTDGTAGIRITSPNHGLNNGQSIEIFNAGTPSYNGLKTITRIDANNFSINQPFADNPNSKGSWDIPVGITQFSPPQIVPALVNAPNHGLETGDRIRINGSGHAPYNGPQTVTVVDVNSFSILVSYDLAAGNPAVKGTWQVDGQSSWRKVASIRLAISSNAKVTAAETEATRIRIAAYEDTRALDACRLIQNAILTSAAVNESELAEEVAAEAATAGREALATSVVRYPSPTLVPSADYDAFVRSGTFSGSAGTAAQAAATAAMEEKANVISTPASISDKAQAAVVMALGPVFSEASRTLLTSLPMTGDFGIGSPGLNAEIVLPANHPTNPFRHRRHPDHTVGFDIRRLVSLSFSGSEAAGRAGYGVDRISGTYDEEIFGLHKPLGTSKNIGLKVRGTFRLSRISLIDTLNGR